MEIILELFGNLKFPRPLPLKNAVLQGFSEGLLAPKTARLETDFSPRYSNSALQYREHLLYYDVWHTIRNSESV
jgi:hypothetical protein